jgi:hypothetical protein
MDFNQLFKLCDLILDNPVKRPCLVFFDIIHYFETSAKTLPFLLKLLLHSPFDYVLPRFFLGEIFRPYLVYGWLQHSLGGYITNPPCNGQIRWRCINKTATVSNVKLWKIITRSQQN